jgi:hypothetical protein
MRRAAPAGWATGAVFFDRTARGCLYALVDTSVELRQNIYHQVGQIRVSKWATPVYRTQISNTDKLLLAFDAFAFAQVAEITPHFGELIAGEQLRRMRVALTPLYLRVRSILETATELFVVPGASPTPVEDEINESGRSQKTSCVKFPRLTRLSKT